MWQEAVAVLVKMIKERRTFVLHTGAGRGKRPITHTTDCLNMEYPVLYIQTPSLDRHCITPYRAPHRKMPDRTYITRARTHTHI